MSITGQITGGAKQAANRAAYSPFIETLTRVGYAARGIVYSTIGLLALRVALGKGGALATPQAAIATIGRQPGGMILLWALLVGLISYSLWGVIRAVLDPLHKGHDAKGLLTRFGYLVSAVSYAILAYFTYGFIQGAAQSSNSAQAHKLLTALIKMPGGRWVIVVIGLAVLASGLAQIYQSLKASFVKRFKIYAMTADQLKLVTRLGQFGGAARGVVFAIVGFLITLGAYRANPSQQVGIDTALAWLRQQPYGVWLLAIVAAGLIAFGVDSILNAVWLRIRR